MPLKCTFKITKTATLCYILQLENAVELALNNCSYYRFPHMNVEGVPMKTFVNQNAVK